MVVATTALVGFRLGGKWLGLFCGAATLYIGLNGYWDSAMLTLSVVAVSVLIAVAFGVAVGILAASSNRFRVNRTTHPGHYAGPARLRLSNSRLDLLRGEWYSGVFLTVVYAIPPVIRLTNLGIRQVPRATIETAYSHGSTSLQTLFQVQLPLAKSSIMLGINQT